MFNRRIKLVCLVIVTLVPGFASAQIASFQGLGPMGDSRGVAVGPVIVGSTAFPARWAGGSLQPVAGHHGGAEAVSSDGAVVVGVLDIAGEGSFPFRWTNSAGAVVLGDLPGIAFGASANGDVVVGSRTTALGGEGFRSTATGIVGLGDLPGGSYFSEARAVSADGSVVVGASHTQRGYEAIRWTEAEGIVPLWNASGSGLYNRAEDVSADGSVIVGYVSYPGGYNAFRWTAGGGSVLLGSLPSGKSTKAYAVSEDGSIVGGGSLYEAAFIWNEEHGIQNLQELLTTDLGLSLNGLQLWSVTGIATTVDEIYLAGNAKNPLGQNEAFLATIPKSALIPEPGSLGLLLLTACGLLRRRRGN